MKKALILAIVLASSTLITTRAVSAPDNWQKHCAKCHGPDGKGDTKMGKKAGVKDLTDPKVQAEITEERVLKSVKEGISENGKEKMKANKELSDADIKALAAHLRTFKK